MSEIINISSQIQAKVDKLKEIRSSLVDRTARKAKAAAEYEKVLAMTMIKLRNGVEMELDGHKVIDVQTTVLEKISRGICWKERLELEEAEGEYKSAITNIETLKAELNGLQSIYKHLDIL